MKKIMSKGPVNNPEGGRLVLVRHGQTVWARDGRYTGRSDILLTKVGRSQAISAAKILQKYKFFDANGNHNADNIFVSPLRRAQETAQLIGFKKYITDRNIAEWDYGNAEGRTRDELSAILGHEFNVWKDGTQIDTSSLADPLPEITEDGEVIEVAKLGGESLEQIANRAQMFLQSIDAKLKNGEDICVVAHAHILRVIVCCHLQIDPKHGAQFFLNTASVSELGFLQNEKSINSWNQIAY